MTQCEQVLKHMKEHGSISSIEAFFDYGITRLSARIWELRNNGYEIETDMMKVKSEKGVVKHYARYQIKTDGDGEQVQNQMY